MRPKGPESNQDWDREIGALWSNILRSQDLSASGRVAEVGPGFTLKVGYGLAGLGFRGTLYVVEPDPAIIRWVTEKYRALLPGARIVPIRSRLGAAALLLPPGLDAILMNHLLDDLLLEAALPKRRRAPTFRNMRPGRPCSPRVLRIWRRLWSEPKKFEAAGGTVIGDLCSLYIGNAPRLMVMNHYRSWFQAHNGLTSVDGILRSMVSRVSRRFRAAEVTDSESSWLLISPEPGMCS